MPLQKYQCHYCKKTFYKPDWRYSQFCSPKCQYLSRVGKPLSEEWRKNTSEGRKGMKFSKSHIKNLSLSHKGKKNSKETRKKMSEAQEGEKSHLWKGGITPENHKIRNNIESCLWRESVFARDNWTCQKYGIKGGKLNAHHIQNFAQYPELRFAIDNGITLSDKAHKEFHKIYGNKNNTKEQMAKFLAKE